jgi:DNA polymerase I-like protein with 3'-5' exonuclease and polymerase domains
LIDIGRITAFDVETKGKAKTYGLQPCRALTGDAWLTTCAVAYPEPGDDLDIATESLVRPTVAQLGQWLDDVADAGHYVVCWNGPFDVGWLIALGLKAKVLRVNWLDGLLIQRHLVNAPKFRKEGQMSMGLKQAVERFLPDRAGYEDDIDYDDESPENISKLLTYNERDSRYTLWLTRHFIQQMPLDMQRCMLIEARSIPMVAEANVMGINVNPDACRTLGERLEETRRTSFVQLKMEHPEDIDEQVLASPKKLGEVLFKKWGLPVVELTDGGEASTNKATLKELALSDPRAKLVHDYREANNNKAKFVTGIIGGSKLVDGERVPVQGSLAYNGDGVVRPAARIFGTYTGRMTYGSKTGRGVEEVPTGIALHQWKRDKEFRRIIEPPEGYTLLEFDFAGQEFRWMGVESGDPTMLALCEPGEDPHAYMAGRATGLQYEWIRDEAEKGNPDAKNPRQLGKVANLSLQFRTYPRTLVRVAAVQFDVKLSLEEATALRANYLTTYKAVPRYWKRQIAMARQRGYVETLAGRRVNLGEPDTWTWTDDEGKPQDYVWGHESTAINFPIQGVGADQKYLAMLVLRDALPRVNGRFYYELHDGLFVVVPTDSRTEKTAHELRHLLSNLPYKRAWGVDLPIKFPVDGKMGPSWGDLKGLT